MEPQRVCTQYRHQSWRAASQRGDHDRRCTDQGHGSLYRCSTALLVRYFEALSRPALSRALSGLRQPPAQARTDERPALVSLHDLGPAVCLRGEATAARSLRSTASENDGVLSRHYLIGTVDPLGRDLPGIGAEARHLKGKYPIRNVAKPPEATYQDRETLMKRYLLAGVSLFALAVGASSAEAAPVTINYTGAAVSFVVPTNGRYEIIAYGAQGGGGGLNSGAGGKGAEIGGDFILAEGEKLLIAVGGQAHSGGQSGSAVSGSGGGGSFVFGAYNAPLVI